MIIGLKELGLGLCHTVVKKALKLRKNEEDPLIHTIKYKSTIAFKRYSRFTADRSANTVVQ